MEPELMPADTYRRIRSAYRDRWGIDVAVSDPQGRITPPSAGSHRRLTEEAPLLRHAIAESLRWGEPSMVTDEKGGVFWAVPLMYNQNLRGGLVALTNESTVLGEGRHRIDLRDASAHLRTLAEEANLTNAALLATRRSMYDQERLRAEAIHEWKESMSFNLREHYLRYEPALVAAIRRGDRKEALAILNRLLVAVHHFSGERIELHRSFAMELVVTMCRTAVEAGGDPQALLGANYTRISALAHIDRQEELAKWLVEMLEHLLDTMHVNRQLTRDITVGDAVAYIRANNSRRLTRDEVAKAVFVSPTHLSRLMKKTLGRGFVGELNAARMARAAELLVRTDLSVGQIATEVGFDDQSYFTKVFRRHMGKTPGAYRHEMAPPSKP